MVVRSVDADGQVSGLCKEEELSDGALLAAEERIDSCSVSDRDLACLWLDPAGQGGGQRGYFGRCRLVIDGRIGGC